MKGVKIYRMGMGSGKRFFEEFEYEKGSNQRYDGEARGLTSTIS